MKRIPIFKKGATLAMRTSDIEPVIDLEISPVIFKFENIKIFVHWGFKRKKADESESLRIEARMTFNNGKDVIIKTESRAAYEFRLCDNLYVNCKILGKMVMDFLDDSIKFKEREVFGIC